MLMRLGKKTTWDKIEEGEVFAILGCVEICQKVNDSTVILLAVDSGNENYIGSKRTTCYGKCDLVERPISEVFNNQSPYQNVVLRKLPKEIQELWLTP